MDCRKFRPVILIRSLALVLVAIASAGAAELDSGPAKVGPRSGTTARPVPVAPPGRPTLPGRRRPAGPTRHPLSSGHWPIAPTPAPFLPPRAP